MLGEPFGKAVEDVIVVVVSLKSYPRLQPGSGKQAIQQRKGTMTPVDLLEALNAGRTITDAEWETVVDCFRTIGSGRLPRAEILVCTEGT